VRHDEDPRLHRPLPWCQAISHIEGHIQLIALWPPALAAALVFLVVPWYLTRWVVRLRLWWLGALPLLWVAVAYGLSFLLLIGLYPRGARRIEVWHFWYLFFLILMLAAAGLPTLVYVGKLISWVRRRCWVRLGMLLAAVPVLSALLAWVLLLRDEPYLHPEQRYSWAGWYWIGVVGVSAVGALFLLVAVLRGAWSVVRRGARLVGASPGQAR
jgi:hypothetical protein